MTLGNPFKRQKSLSELEEEDERLDTELSVTQKRVAIAKLKERGLSPKHFGFDYRKIIAWLKSH